MNCNDAASLIAAYADGETGRSAGALDRQPSARPVRECAAKHEDLLALRAQLRAEVPRYSAPPALRARVLATLEPRRRDACAQATVRPLASAGGASAGGAAARIARNRRSLALAHRRRAGRLRGHRARMVRRHDGDRLARERRHRRRGGDVARAGDARQPVDPGRVVEPAHGEAVAVGAARLFAAGAGPADRRVSRSSAAASTTSTSIPSQRSSTGSATTTSTCSCARIARARRRRHCGPCAASTSRMRPDRAWTGSPFPM